MITGAGRLLLTVKETAEYLSISQKHLYRLISQRRIPFIHKPGIGYRFFRSSLETWLLEGFEPASGWQNHQKPQLPPP